MTDQTPLPSWRPGPTRDALTAFLDASREVPVEERFATLDNDGTLWCEKPQYAQLAFFLDALGRRVAEDPSIAERPELAALIHHDQAAIAEIGLPRIAVALAGLFAGTSPEDFTDRVRAFMAEAVHPTFGRPLRSLVYQPMLDLIDELRRREFTVAIVTGGGTEFVRAVSQDLYGVAPELVVGTLIAYDHDTDPTTGAPCLRRTAAVLGEANEGPAKVTNIQTQLGRRPILAAGNSAGDREMLEWARSGPHPGLALLVDHDDEEREVAYRSEAATFDDDAPITEIAAQLGWTTASMARDWATVFPAP